MRRNTFKPDLLTAVRKTVNPNAEYGRSICCPFHRETDPSLHIFENQSWYCFGCGKGGDVYDFLGFLRYGDSWDSRNKEMFREIGKSVDNFEFKKVYVDYNAQTQMPEISEETKEAFLLAAQTYHQALISGMENGADTARSYLYSRGITDKTIRKLKIGYAGRSELHKKGITLRPDERTVYLEKMKNAGFIKYGKEYFSNRIIFPNITKSGDVQTLTGRALNPAAKRYLNIPNVRKKLYLLELADPEKELYITESVTDAVSLQQLGYSAAAVNGTAMSKQMKASLEAYKKIIIVPQNDMPSMNAACSWCEAIPRCRIMLPEYIDGEEKDVNDILRLEGEHKCGSKLRTAADNLLDCSDYAERVREKYLLWSKNENQH